MNDQQITDFTTSDSSPPATLDQALSLWNIQDSLLQQYRVIFITTQSVLISFAAGFTDPNKPLGAMLALTLVAGVTQILWMQLCSARGRSVFFAQALALKIERGQTVYRIVRQLKQYQERDSPLLFDDEDYRTLIGGGTRTRGKMERVLPALFIAAWLLMWATRYAEHFTCFWK